MKSAFLLLPVLLLVLTTTAGAEDRWPQVIESADGVPISYEVYGSGEPTLVLIHGWSCDGRYWRTQIDEFAADHQIVVIDLAGHGHSGLGREHYSMDAFGQDVAAVVQAVGPEQLILIGHSMGGSVSVAAARHLTGRLVGIIGVDTFQSLGHVPGEEEVQAWMAPLEADFSTGAQGFVAQMFIESSDAALRDWVISDMAAAPPEVAISAMTQMLGDMQSDQARGAFSELEVPVIAINADIWPTDIEGNQQLLESFQAVILPETDHFLHMAQPERFNRELRRAIRSLTD